MSTTNLGPVQNGSSEYGPTRDELGLGPSPDSGTYGPTREELGAPTDDAATIWERSKIQAEAAKKSAEARRQASEGIARWTKPGGIPHDIAKFLDYAVPAAAEATVDGTLALGAGLINWAGWGIDQIDRAARGVAVDGTSKPIVPELSAKSALSWLTNGEYGRRVDYGRRQFEGETGEFTPMMGARLVAQEAIGLFTSFGAAGVAAKALKGGGAISAAARGAANVLGAPGHVLRLFETPVDAERYTNVALRLAKKVGMEVDEVNAALASGRLTRTIVSKLPASQKLLGFLALKSGEIASTTTGLGALGVIQGANAAGGADPVEALKTAVHTAILSPVMVGMGSLAKTVQAGLGGKLTGKVIAGAMEGTGFAAITMGPKEWHDYGTALLEGNWDKVGEGTVKILGQAVGMAALRGFSTDGLPAWRRNFPQDRVKPLQDLVTNADRISNLQELGWVGSPTEGGNVEFRQPGRAGKFELREGEGGKLSLTMDGQTVTGDDARMALRYLEARTLGESLLPHLRELPDSWTETVPGVFRDVSAAKEYTFRSNVWQERDLTKGGNAPWEHSEVYLPLRAARRIEGDLKDDIQEVARLIDTATKEMPQAIKDKLDPLFHVELGQHIMASLVGGPDGAARSEARAFLRSSPHLPASEVLRSTAKLLAGLSNARHELAKGQRPPTDPGGKQGVSRASAGASRSEEIARSADWSKASRATRRTSASEYIQARADEGKETSDEDLRATFGMKSAKTRKKVRRAAEEPLAGYGASTGSAGLEGEPGIKTIRLQDVSRALRGRPGDPVHATGREAGINRRGALGVYYAFHDVDRAKVASDWATRAHEWAHAMERTIGGVNGIGSIIPPELLQEASTVARFYGDRTGRGLGLAKIKDPRRLAGEVWAEYWARHILGDSARLQQEAPRFTEWVTNWLNGHPALKSQVEYLTDVMHRWQYQGAKARGAAMIVSQHDKPSPEQKMVEGSRLKNILKAIEHQFFDAGGELRRIEEELTGDGPDVKPSRSVWKTARLYSMAARSEAERFLLHGTHDIYGNKTGESTLDILKSAPESEHPDIVNLMVALREAEMMGKGLVTSGSREELSARIRQLEPHKTYETKDGPVSRVQIARRWNDFFNRVVDHVVELGGIDEKSGDLIKNSSIYFNPFFRQFFEDAPSSTAAGENVPGPAFRRMRTGGVRPVLDPREAAQKFVIRALTSGHNAAVRNVLAAKIAMEGMGRMAFEVPIERVPHDHPMRQLLEEAAKVKTKVGSAEHAIKLLEIAQATPETEALEFWAQSKRPDSRRPWIVHTPHWSEEFIADVAKDSPESARLLEAKNHKQMWIELDPRVYEYMINSSIGNMGRAEMGLSASKKLVTSLAGISRMAAGAVRFGVTETSPLFLYRNTLKDAFNYPLYATPSDDVTKWFKALGPFEGLATFIHTVGSIVKGDPLWKKFEARGGSIPTMIRTELGFSGWKQADLFSETKTAIGKIRQGLRAYVDFLSKGESVLRFREFKTIYEKRLKEGWSEADAINDATFGGKDLMDYTSGGVLARQWSQYIPYLNAHLVGERKFWRTAMGAEGEERQTRLWTHAIVNFGSMTMAAWLLMKLQKKEDQWAALDEKRRLMYWHLSLPGTENFIEVPKPYDAAVLVSGIMDQTLARFGKTHPQEVMTAVLNLLGNVAGPFGNPATLTPAIIKPAFEAWAGKDFFSGKKIVPDWMEENKIPEQQAHRWNSTAAKKIAEFLGKSIGLHTSPAKWDHILGGYSGGLWNAASRWVDDVSSAVNGEGISPGLLGGLGRVVVHPYQSSQRVTDLYERLSDLRQRGGSKLLDGPEKNKLHILDRAATKMAKARETKGSNKATIDAELHRIAVDALTRSGY